MVAVLFAEPVLGPDPRDGDQFLSTKHWLEAAYCIQNGKTVAFIDFDGQVIAEWPSSAIRSINWPESVTDENEDARPIDRYRQIKEKYPKAWSSWSEQEEESLVLEFERGEPLAFICDSHERAPGGIIARLRNLGLVDPKASRSEVEEVLNSRRVALRLHVDLGAVEDSAGSSEESVLNVVRGLEEDAVGVLHKFFYYESAGVSRKTRVMNNITGSCSCGGWQKTMGSIGSLKSYWQDHVDEATAQ